VGTFPWNPLRWRRRTAVIAATAAATAIVLAVSLVLGLTGGSSPARPSQPPRSSQSPSSPPTRSPLLSPFTGEPMTAPGPVLAVKIDNIGPARPPTGLTSADIVYILPVEGGLSRILAVFSSRLPPVIGPVRSAREADLELLAQFGRPAFAYSGATSRLLPFVARSQIADLYAGRAGGYFRDPQRLAPHNLYARTRQLVAQAPGASPARDIGFRFGAAPAGGRPGRSRSPTPRRPSRSTGTPPAAAGWCPWTAGQQAPRRAASSARRRW